MLEQSAQLLHLTQRTELAQRLEAALAQPALAKPSDHKGSPATDMFVLALDPPQRETVLASIVQAQAQGLCTTGTQQRGLGGFIEAWSEYARS